MAMNVRTLCLGILSLKDVTGYEIKKMMEEGIFSHFIDASYGSIYPALAQLLKEELVTVRTEAQVDGRPARKIYSITEKGHEVFSQAINTDPAQDKFKSEFLFQMLFADRIDQAHLAVIYDTHLEELEAELRHIEESSKELPNNAGARLVNDYGRIMLRTALSFFRERRQEILQTRADGGNNAADKDTSQGENKA